MWLLVWICCWLKYIKSLISNYGMPTKLIGTIGFYMLVACKCECLLAIRIWFPWLCLIAYGREVSNSHGHVSLWSDRGYVVHAKLIQTRLASTWQVRLNGGNDQTYASEWCLQDVHASFSNYVRNKSRRFFPKMKKLSKFVVFDQNYIFNNICRDYFYSNFSQMLIVV